jgi:hypoxanthine phosphoribosyltransferase
MPEITSTNPRQTSDHQRELQSLEIEWRETRSTIDRFDRITVDLRKYGFSLITIMITGSSILFDITKLNSPLSLVIIPTVIVLLILGLFFIDSYYVILLMATILRSEFIENTHQELLGGQVENQIYYGLSITSFLEDKVQKSRAHYFTILLYICFLLASVLLGMFSLSSYRESTGRALSLYFEWMLVAIFFTAMALMYFGSGGVSRLIGELQERELVDNRFTIQKIFDQTTVTKKTKELAKRIYEHYRKSSFKVLTLGMGGLYFANNLISQLRKLGMTNIELISAFSDRNNNTITIETPNLSDIQDENILIVDDLVSTGFTMAKAKEICQELGAKSVKTCALLDAYRKRHSEIRNFKVEFSGLRSSDTKHFFVGSGLDGGKRMSEDARNQVRLLPYIGILLTPISSVQEDD